MHCSLLFVLVAVASAAPYVPSAPTSSHPRMLWPDATIQAGLNSLKNYASGTYGYDIYQWMLRHSDDDANWVTGFIPAILYKVTGDVTHAHYAWQLVTDQYIGAGATTDGNFYRRWGVRVALIYDWVYPTLSSAQKTAFFNYLNARIDYIATTNTDGTPTHLRDADTDETLGWYMHVVMAHAACGDENPHPGDVLRNTAWLGGLQKTKNNDVSTTRNELYALMTWLGKGGAWPESIYYDGGTLGMLMLACASLKTAYGTDYFPEAPTYFNEIGNFWLWSTTPDQKAMYLWGDEGESGQCRDWSYRGANAVGIQLMVASTAGDATVRGRAFDYFKHQFEANLFTGGWLPDEALFFWKDTMTRGDLTSGTTGGYFSDSTAGVGLYKTGWGNQYSLFGFEYPQAYWLDHMMCFHGNLQFWRKGEWIFYNPASYGGPTTTGQEGSNTMKLAAFPLDFAPEAEQANEAKGVIGTLFTNTFAFVQGIHAGNWNYNGSWYVPPTCQHEHTRSMLYLPSTDNTHDTILVYDRLYVEDPRTDPSWNQQYTFSSDEKTAINAMVARKVWYVHFPTTPTVASGKITWTTSGGQSGRLQTLTPCKYGSVINEKTYSAWNTYDVDDSEKHFHTTIMPTVDQDWDAMLHVAQFWDTSAVGSALVNTLVQTADKKVTGVLLVYPTGTPNTLVLYNSEQSAQLPSPSDPHDTGQFFWDPTVPTLAKQAHLHKLDATTRPSFTVTVTTTTADLRVFVIDCVANTQYTVTAGSVSHTVAAQSGGVFTYTLTGVGTGSKSVTFGLSGSQPPASSSSHHTTTSSSHHTTTSSSHHTGTSSSHHTTTSSSHHTTASSSHHQAASSSGGGNHHVNAGSRMFAVSTVFTVVATLAAILAL